VKYITWVDEKGYKRRSAIRDSDPDTMAPQGIPAGPPDLQRLDWENLVKELNNMLVDREINSWRDIQVHQNAVSNAIVSIFKRPIVALYREQRND
jgi:hypothetical protein